MQTNIDLVSFVLTLTPMQAAKPDRELPQWWGRAAHALLLNVIEATDGELAKELHGEEGGLRPFTASTLMGFSVRRGLEMEKTYTLRLTAYHRKVAGPLLRAAEPGGRLAPGAAVDLDGLPFQVSKAEGGSGLQSGVAEDHPPASHGWAGASSYPDLSAPFLLGARALPRQVHFQFSSPTSFKSGGMHVPIPMPGLVFGSLLDRWNAFAQIAFPAEVKRYAEECLAVSRIDLSSRGVPGKGESVRVGGVGEMRYTTLNYDRYWMSLIHTLAAFARYAGVGVGTSHGMGQCRTLRIE